MKAKWFRGICDSGQHADVLRLPGARRGHIGPILVVSRASHVAESDRHVCHEHWKHRRRVLRRRHVPTSYIDGKRPYRYCSYYQIDVGELLGARYPCQSGFSIIRPEEDTRLQTRALRRWRRCRRLSHRRVPLVRCKLIARASSGSTVAMGCEGLCSVSGDRLIIRLLIRLFAYLRMPKRDCGGVRRIPTRSIPIPMMMVMVVPAAVIPATVITVIRRNDTAAQQRGDASNQQQGFHGAHLPRFKMRPAYRAPLAAAVRNRFPTVHCVTADYSGQNAR